MKKLVGLLSFVALLGAHANASGDPLSTDRRVFGVITAVEPDVVTIAGRSHSVTGRVDPERTKVTVNGRPASLKDLKLTARAKAELCLDDVWLRIDTH